MCVLMHKDTRALSEQKMIHAMKRKNSSRSQEWSWFSMLDNYPDVLSFRQVMEITHVGRNLLLRLLNSGEIPAFKMGKLWKVYKQDLIQYMSQCQWALSFVWGKKNPVGLRSRNPAGFDSIDLLICSSQISRRIFTPCTYVKIVFGHRCLLRFSLLHRHKAPLHRPFPHINLLFSLLSSTAKSRI